MTKTEKLMRDLEGPFFTLRMANGLLSRDKKNRGAQKRAFAANRQIHDIVMKYSEECIMRDEALVELSNL